MENNVPQDKNVPQFVNNDELQNEISIYIEKVKMLNERFQQEITKSDQLVQTLKKVLAKHDMTRYTS